MQDTLGVDKYMKPVAAILHKHIHNPGVWTEIYNRSWEAVNNALRDASQPSNHADGEKLVLDGTFECPECGFKEKHLARCSRR